MKFRLYADLCCKLKRNDVDLVLLSLSGNLILNDEIVRNGEVLYASDDAAREEFELKVLHLSPTSNCSGDTLWGVSCGSHFGQIMSSRDDVDAPAQIPGALGLRA